MTDPATRDRLTALQARLALPTPRPLEGQETIHVGDEDDQPQTVTQPPLW